MADQGALLSPADVARRLQIPLRSARELMSKRMQHVLVGRHLRVTERALAACVRAGVPPTTWNDLRRTSGQWLRRAGAAPHLIGRFLRHASSKMAEQVYAALDALAWRRCWRRPRPRRRPPGRPGTGAPVGRARAVLNLYGASAPGRVLGGRNCLPPEAVFSGKFGGPSGARTRDRRIKRPAGAQPSARGAVARGASPCVEFVRGTT